MSDVGPFPIRGRRSVRVNQSSTVDPIHFWFPITFVRLDFTVNKTDGVGSPWLHCGHSQSFFFSEPARSFLTFRFQGPLRRRWRRERREDRRVGVGGRRFIAPSSRMGTGTAETLSRHKGAAKSRGVGPEASGNGNFGKGDD